MLNFRNLTNLHYFFQFDLMLTRSDKLFLITGAIAVILSIILKIAAVTSVSPIDKKFRNQLFNLLLTIGIWELVWFGCRYENATFFGTHFVALLGLLVGLIWLAFIIVKMVKEYSPAKKQWEKEQVKLRYLPK